jgi:hypothetical protein
VPRCPRRSPWYSPALPYRVTFDAEDNVCPRLSCSWCDNLVTDGPEAAVQVTPSVRLVCGRCVSNLDDAASVVPLADFLVALVRNASLGDLLRPDVDDELIPGPGWAGGV